MSCDLNRDLNRDPLALLASGDLCSKRWIWEQYDSTIRTNTLKPAQAETRPSSESKKQAQASPCRSTATAATFAFPA